MLLKTEKAYIEGIRSSIKNLHIIEGSFRNRKIKALDVDATLKNLPLNEESARKIVAEITTIRIDDGVTFEIKSVCPIRMRRIKDAFINTSKKRGSISLLSDVDLILKEIAERRVLLDLWHNYQRKLDYAAHVLWDDVIKSVVHLIEIVK